MESGQPCKPGNIPSTEYDRANQFSYAAEEAGRACLSPVFVSRPHSCHWWTGGKLDDTHAVGNDGHASATCWTMRSAMRSTMRSPSTFPARLTSFVMAPNYWGCGHRGPAGQGRRGGQYEVGRVTTLSGGPNSSRARGIRGEDAEVTAPEGQQKSQGPCPRSEGASRDVRFLVDTQDEQREYITMSPAVDKHSMPHR